MLKKIIAFISSFSALFSHSYGMEVEQIDLRDNSKPIIVAPDSGGSGGQGGSGS